jgi:hypothetical protein
MNKELQDTLVAITSPLLGVIGGLAGGLFAHWLTKGRDAQMKKAILDREADVRKRKFRQHILRCRYALERVPHDKPNEVWTAYASMAPEILAEAQMVAGDFQPEFITLVRRAGEWEYAEEQA